jgi:hypothetical protein
MSSSFRLHVIARDIHGMHERREHLPSPVKRRILSSQIKGMERPVRSFQSFIRKVPPNPSTENDKPLPPTPSTSSDRSPPPVLPTPIPTSPESAWKAPTEREWDNPSPPSQVPTTSIFTARNYSPLIPDSSLGLSSVQTDSSSWPFEISASHNPRLHSIRERSKARPSTPPRNPSRPSPIYTPSTEINSALGISSSDYSPLGAALLSGIEMMTALPDSPVELQPSSDFAYRISDASTKAKAYASLDIGSPRNTKAAWEDWSNNAGLSHTESGTSNIRSLRSNKLPPLSRINPTMDEELGEAELSDKMQLLSFSHDYHNVLADQYHPSNPQPDNKDMWTTATAMPKHPEMPRPMLLSKDHELMPEPLAWRKGPDDGFSDDFSIQASSNGPLTSQSRNRHQRMASWTSLRHLHDGGKKRSADGDVLPRSTTSDPSVPRRKHIPDSEVDRILGGKKLMPNLLSHTKNLIPNKRRAKAMGTANLEGVPASSSRLPLATIFVVQSTLASRGSTCIGDELSNAKLSRLSSFAALSIRQFFSADLSTCA